MRLNLWKARTDSIMRDGDDALSRPAATDYVATAGDSITEVIAALERELGPSGNVTITRQEITWLGSVFIQEVTK